MGPKCGEMCWPLLLGLFLQKQVVEPVDVGVAWVEVWVEEVPQVCYGDSPAVVSGLLFVVLPGKKAGVANAEDVRNATSKLPGSGSDV